MLLSVLALAEAGRLADGCIRYSPVLLEIFGRFFEVVRRAYDYTCAMCGVRFMLDDVILVDAAHLIPFSESHDDSPPNGIALCKNHHWLMDRHLIAPGPSRGDDYSKPVWLISSLLDDRIEAHRACVEHKGRRVILPREERHHPSPRALAWQWCVMRLRDKRHPERALPGS